MARVAGARRANAQASRELLGHLRRLFTAGFEQIEVRSITVSATVAMSVPQAHAAESFVAWKIARANEPSNTLGWTLQVRKQPLLLCT